MLNKMEIEIIRNIVAISDYTEVEKVELLAGDTIELIIDGIKEDVYTNKVEFLDYIIEGLEIGATEIEKEFVNVLNAMKTGNKIQTTNNDFKVITNKLANKFYNNFKVYDSILDYYDIIPFSINIDNELVKKVINAFCSSEEQREFTTLYRGRIGSVNSVHNLKKDLNMTTINDDYYNISLYNKDLKLFIDYTEGDLNFALCDTVENFEKELSRVKKFYAENY